MRDDLGCDHVPAGRYVTAPTEGLPVRCKRCGHRGVAYPLTFGVVVEWEIEFPKEEGA